MWIVWVLVGLAALVWLGYMWFTTLMTKYEHTAASRIVLACSAALGVYAGWKLAVQVLPESTYSVWLLIALTLGAALFGLFSYIVVNIWCALLTRPFDEQIAALEEEEDRLLRRLEELRWRSHDHRWESELVPEKTAADQPNDDETSLEKFIENWQQSGNAARIRSLKVSEWKEEMRNKTVEELNELIAGLAREVESELDESKRETNSVRLAVARLELLSRNKAGMIPGSARSRPEKLEKVSVDSCSNEIALRERLQEIRRLIQVKKSQKADFLRSRIRLSWGGRR